MKLTIISGTNRRDSRTLLVAKHVAGLYGAVDGVDVTLVDLQDLPPGLLDPDAYANKPEALTPMVDAVLHADGLVIVTPEYNGSFPGALKLFIDMLPFPQAFDKRPVAFIGIAAGYWGGLRPVEHLQQVFGYRNALQYPERVFCPSAHNSIDEHGAPTVPLAIELLGKQVTGFVDFIRRLKA